MTFQSGDHVGSVSRAGPLVSWRSPDPSSSIAKRSPDEETVFGRSARLDVNRIVPSGAHPPTEEDPGPFVSRRT